MGASIATPKARSESSPLCQRAARGARPLHRGAATRRAPTVGRGIGISPGRHTSALPNYLLGHAIAPSPLGRGRGGEGPYPGAQNPGTLTLTLSRRERGHWRMINEGLVFLHYGVAVARFTSLAAAC